MTFGRLGEKEFNGHIFYTKGQYTKLLMIVALN